MDGSEKITGPESKRILILDLGMVSEVRAVAKRSYPTSKEKQLRGWRRAERTYSTFKVRHGHLIQGKEQQLCFAGAAVKRYPASK